MKADLIQEKHRQWLREHLNLTFEEIDEMDDEQDDELCSTLLNAECDALDEEGDDLDTICEIEDIIFGGRE